MFEFLKSLLFSKVVEGGAPECPTCGSEMAAGKKLCGGACEALELMAFS